jgi:hypothetical protein
LGLPNKIFNPCSDFWLQNFGLKLFFLQYNINISIVFTQVKSIFNLYFTYQFIIWKWFSSFDNTVGSMSVKSPLGLVFFVLCCYLNGLKLHDKHQEHLLCVKHWFKELDPQAAAGHSQAFADTLHLSYLTSVEMFYSTCSTFPEHSRQRRPKEI